MATPTKTALLPTALPAVLPSFAPAKPGFTALAEAPPPNFAAYVQFPMSLSKNWQQMVAAFPQLAEFTPILHRSPMPPIKLDGENFKIFIPYGELFFARIDQTGGIVQTWRTNPDPSDYTITSVALTASIVDLGPDKMPVPCAIEFRRAMDVAPRQIIEAQKESLLDSWPKQSEKHALAFSAFKTLPWARIRATVKISTRVSRGGKRYAQSAATCEPTPMDAATRLLNYLSAPNTAAEIETLKAAFNRRVSEFQQKMT